MARRSKRRKLEEIEGTSNQGPSLWPGGSNWQPQIPEGTRKAGFYGCGKCRWGPKGCRGCRAAAVVTDPPAPLPAGEVLAPLLTKGQQEQLTSLLEKVSISAGPSQSDPDGHGIVARVDLSAGQTLIDPTAPFVQRPPAYARAHLPAFDYVAFGSGYFQLRELTLRKCSVTFFINEANYGEEEEEGEQPVNCAYKATRPKGGGVVMSWAILQDVRAGEELLTTYSG